MPRFGYKCFVGSFLLSLVAVFAATKAYLVLAQEEQKNTIIPLPAETRNIELFAANEESDPIAEKLKKAENEELLPDNLPEAPENNLTVAEQEDILYMPQDKAETETNLAFNEVDSTVSQNPTETISASGEKVVSELSENTEETNKEEELKIADASTAPVFKIPLIHHYKTESGTVSVSNEASASQIAMASHNVAFRNLGADNQASLTEQTAEAENILTGSSELEMKISAPKMEVDNPWEVAETANKHASKNTIDAYAAEKKSEIAALDQRVEEETPQPAQPQQTAYKMQKNILIPIPEDILNNPNLTPQFSSSEENLRLEEELRARHQLPSLPESGTIAVGNDGEKDFEQNDEPTSQSLTDSIAEWFSSAKPSVKSSSGKNVKSNSNTSKDNKKTGSENQESNNSLFKKLLNIGKDDSEKNIIPSELKLAFQPNRAEISGQTLEWLRAFSRNAIENENVIIEIRLSQSAPVALQHKRLKLLHKILANNGVDYNKINIIFTDREPNSFIIRNVRYATEEEMAKVMKKADNPWF